MTVDDILAKSDKVVIKPNRVHRLAPASRSTTGSPNSDSESSIFVVAEKMLRTSVHALSSGTLFVCDFASVVIRFDAPRTVLFEDTRGYRRHRCARLSDSYNAKALRPSRANRNSKVYSTTINKITSSRAPRILSPVSRVTPRVLVQKCRARQVLRHARRCVRACACDFVTRVLKTFRQRR